MEREKKMRWNYILFDLDGTLLDTSAGIQKSVEHTLYELSLPKLSPEQYSAHLLGRQLIAHCKALFIFTE